MATGITNNERLSPLSRTAKRIETSSGVTDLPVGQRVALSYSGKMPEADILTLNKSVYVKAGSKKNTSTSTIEDDSFVLSDNLLALSNLKIQNKKFKLIYLDPPYGTGMGFQTRSHMHAYEDSSDLSSYIEFMRRRLVLLREVLDNDGSIYVHIGHQMVFHLKILMDEIFGQANFRNMITRRKCSSKNFTKNQYGNLNDYILFYTKSGSYIWNQPGVLPEKEWLDKEYPKQDKKGRYKLVPIHAPGTRNGETGKEWKGMMPPPGKHWQFQPSKLDEFDKNGDIHWSKTGNPRRKVYLTESKMLPMTDYWHDFRDAYHQSIKITGYPTEKNFDMLKLIVQASSNPGDLVLDPFCGSGTTLHAAADLGRRFIGIDESFMAAHTVLNRFKIGVNEMGDYVNKKVSQPNLLETSKPVSNLNLFIERSTFELHKDEVMKLATEPAIFS